MRKRNRAELRRVRWCRAWSGWYEPAANVLWSWNAVHGWLAHRCDANGRPVSGLGMTIEELEARP